MKQLTVILDNSAGEAGYQSSVEAFCRQIDEQRDVSVRANYSHTLDRIEDNLSPDIDAHALVLFLNGTRFSDALWKRINALAASPKTWLSILYSNLPADAAQALDDLQARYPAYFIVRLDLRDPSFQENLDKLSPYVLRRLDSIRSSAPDNEEAFQPPAEKKQLSADDEVDAADMDTAPHIPIDDREDTVRASTPTRPHQPVVPMSVIAPHIRPGTEQAASRRETREQQAINPYLKPVLFGYQEPPESYPYPTEAYHSVQGVASAQGSRWAIAAASIRGRKHRNEGTHRDDAFAITTAGGWHIIAAADGAGSAEFSRVTANKSVEIAVETVAAHAAKDTDTDAAKIEQRMRLALQAAIEQVYRIHEDWTNRLGVTQKQTNATFMLLLHRPLPDGSAVAGWLNVGDGYMYAVGPDRVRRMTEGDHGSEQSTTKFVLSFPLDELLKRAETYTFQKPDVPDFFALMTDGIADDLKPSSEEYAQGTDTIDSNAEKYIRNLQNNYMVWPRAEDWGLLLLDAINYERKGSNDDRTLAVLALAPRDQ